MLVAMSLIAGCAATARGNLGETVDEIEARYGAAQETKTNAESDVTNNYYIHDGFGISVKFLDGKSQSESYLKAQKIEITDAEITALLKANAMGSDWLSVYKTSAAERWELKSRDATAVYSRDEHTLIISTKEFIHSGNKIRTVDPAK